MNLPENKISDKKALEVKAKYRETKAAIAETETQLQAAVSALSEARINAITTGKPVPQSVRDATLKLQEKLGDLEEAIPYLEEAHRAVLAQEQDAAAQGLKQRQEQLRADYREAVRGLITAVEAAVAALAAVNAVHSKFALLENGAIEVHKIVCRFDLGTEEGRAAFGNQICLANMVDLLPANHIARLRFEHQAAHDAEQARRIAAGRSDVWNELDRLSRGGEPSDFFTRQDQAAMVPDGGRPQPKFLGEIVGGGLQPG